ncbi:WD40 repeat domain-containing protein [Campylobacter estrildidarum]|uniref:NapL protein n=1 Tax=Campylobacter estrildidarum TaxID=2510189 RepID=A0A4U7BIG5_9BACT|nr:WD40 repeat domain-containing protein [Campylobacter estrildidarum]TKX29935.1 napL protein [Campylobacter estrildidarum]
MKKIFCILSFFYLFSYAYELKINSNITALKLGEQNLYIGTEKGEILKYNIQDKSLKKLLSLPKIKDYYGDNFAKIYNIDLNHNTLLILSEGDFGNKNLSFYNKKLTIKKLQEQSVKKVFFIDNNTFLFVLLDSEIILVDHNLKKIKEFQFSHSSLSDAVLNEDKTQLVAGFESGEVKLFDLKKWKILKNYDEIHKDNIYQVDFKKNIILSCGTDRRLGIVKNNKQYFLQKDFLIYTCALSPSGKFAIYSDNEAEISEIFNTNNFNSIAKFHNAGMMSEFIIFINENEFIISGFGDKILFRSVDESL